MVAAGHDYTDPGARAGRSGSSAIGAGAGAGLRRCALSCALGCALLLASRATDAQGPAPPASGQHAGNGVAAFSRMAAGGSTAPWEPIVLSRRKRPTRYALVDDAGTVVLQAIADNAASVLAVATDIDPRATPVVTWRWKVAGLIADADPRLAAREDSPARLVLEFDGDRSTLPLIERGVYALSRRISGRELPYATLIYFWANRQPVGTVIASPRTGRVQMVVASSGTRGVGSWQSLSRNLRADFLRAFGEEPGRLTAVGVFTDTDNTGGDAEAWYGDVRFHAEER